MPIPPSSPRWRSVGGFRTKERMALSEKEKMLSGELYRPTDPRIQADLAATSAWLVRYNASSDASVGKRRKLLTERLGAVGEGAVIRSPFFCDYGFNIRLGSNVFLNFNCVILDVVEVSIDEGTQIGPAVQIYTVEHPRDPIQRREGLEFGRPVRIGRNVWIGGGAIILPGVKVGNNAIIGAGSVVTRCGGWSYGCRQSCPSSLRLGYHRRRLLSDLGHVCQTRADYLD